MATTKDYLQFIVEQLSELDEIAYRSMMGEYIFYYRGKIAAYVCDNRFLVKPVEAAKKMLPTLRYEAPYEGAKDMLLVEDLEDKQFLKELMEAMYPELPEPKPKKKKQT